MYHIPGKMLTTIIVNRTLTMIIFITDYLNIFGNYA